MEFGSRRQGMSQWYFVRLEITEARFAKRSMNFTTYLQAMARYPLIMKEWLSMFPMLARYAPVTVLVDERKDGVHLSYDSMSSLLAPYENPDALQVARDPDEKVEDLLQRAAA